MQLVKLSRRKSKSSLARRIERKERRKFNQTVPENKDILFPLGLMDKVRLLGSFGMKANVVKRILGIHGN